MRALGFSAVRALVAGLLGPHIPGAQQQFFWSVTVRRTCELCFSCVGCTLH